MSDDRQATLFALPPAELEAAPPSAEQSELAQRLPRDVRLGTMSWAFPGWRGVVYGREAPPSALSRQGLGAYSKHPLLGAVEIDRSYYEPLGAAVLREYADQVPESFRFLIKAHEVCSVRRFPTHARYGSRRGESNPLYLDASYASDAVIGPIAMGLGAKVGAILFQFPPAREALEPEAFADELSAFLSRLPRGIPYAIELRRADQFGPRYLQALVEQGAVHCHNAWSAMPPVLAQARQVPPRARNPLIIRWLLAPVKRTRAPASASTRSSASRARTWPCAGRSRAWWPGPRRGRCRRWCRSTTRPRGARRRACSGWHAPSWTPGPASMTVRAAPSAAEALRRRAVAARARSSALNARGARRSAPLSGGKIKVTAA